MGERDRKRGEGKGHTPMRVTFWMDEDILNAGKVHESFRGTRKNLRVDIGQGQ